MKIEEQVSIVETGPEYSKVFAEIYHEAFLGAPEQLWSSFDIESLLRIPGTKSFVINYENEPIGFSIVREIIDEAEIITFCILPKRGKNGYATMLLEWVINQLQIRSFKRLFLEVRENNEAAIKLYRKCNFNIIGRRKGYYNSSQSENEDALVMQCNLKQALT